MNSFVRCGMLMIVLISMSACDTTPKGPPVSGPTISGGLVIGAVDRWEAEKWYSSEDIRLISYTTPDGLTVKVLFGPNAASGEIATGRFMINGDFELEMGFAYMHVGGPTSTPRPCIRTRRITATGKGTAWAMQIRAFKGPGETYEDRIYFVEGTELNYDAIPALSTTPDPMRDHYTFTYYPFTDPGGEAKFAPPASYVAGPTFTPDDTAYDFAYYVDLYHSWSGMPRMYPTSP